MCYSVNIISMISKNQPKDKQRIQDSEQSVTNKTVTRKRKLPTDDTEILPLSKKRRISTDDIVTFVHQESPSADVDKMVTVPQRVPKRKTSRSLMRNTEHIPVIKKRRISTDEIVTFVHQESPSTDVDMIVTMLERVRKRKATRSLTKNTENIPVNKKRRISTDRIIIFVHQESPSADVDKMVTVPQRVRKRKATRSLTRNTEHIPVIKKRRILTDDVVTSVHRDLSNKAMSCSPVEDVNTKRPYVLKEMGFCVLEKEEVEAMSGSLHQSVIAGSLGNCIKTVDPRTYQQVVIKNLNGNFNCLFTELRTLHQLQMPGVQRLMGVCSDTCQLLTYYAGHTALHYFMNAVPFVGVFDAANIFLQIARALKAIIDRGFTHNDLKDNNVCVSDKDNHLVATIIDLGLASPIGTERIYEQNFSPEVYPWLAPELLTHTHPSSEMSDVYSLAYMMLKLLKLKQGYVCRQVDAGLIWWIEAAMSPEPAQRPTLAVLVMVLERILHDSR